MSVVERVVGSWMAPADDGTRDSIEPRAKLLQAVWELLEHQLKKQLRQY